MEGKKNRANSSVKGPRREFRTKRHTQDRKSTEKRPQLDQFDQMNGAESTYFKRG